VIEGVRVGDKGTDEARGVAGTLLKRGKMRELVLVPSSATKAIPLS
jgi:hypothetical protein